MKYLFSWLLNQENSMSALHFILLSRKFLINGPSHYNCKNLKIDTSAVTLLLCMKPHVHESCQTLTQAVAKIITRVMFFISSEVKKIKRVHMFLDKHKLFSNLKRLLHQSLSLLFSLSCGSIQTLAKYESHQRSLLDFRCSTHFSPCGIIISLCSVLDSCRICCDFASIWSAA